MAIPGPRLRATIELDHAAATRELRIFTQAYSRQADRLVSSNKKIRDSAKRNMAAIRGNIKAEEDHVRSLEREMRQLERSEKAAIDKKIANERLKQATLKTAKAEMQLANASKRSAAAARAGAHSFGTFSKALGTSITLWYTARTAVFAFRRALEGILSIYRKGIEEIDDFRLSIIGASAVMIPSIEAGTTAAEKMAIAWEHNKSMMLELELVAARHISTGKSLQEVYTGMVIAQVFPKEADVENVAKIADYITIYTKGQQLGRQLLQEIRGLMDGQVRQTNKLAYMLDQIIPGGLKKNLALWKAQGRDADGQLVILKMINKYLGDIGVLQEEILGNVSTWANTLQTIATRILRQAVQPAYDDIANFLERVTRSLIDQEMHYTTHAQLIEAIIKHGWNRLKDIVRGFVGGPLKATEATIEGILLDLGEWVTNAGPKAVDLGRSIRSTLESIYWLLVNIKQIVVFLIAARMPVWIGKIIQVFAGMTTAAGAGSPVAIASLIGLAIATLKVAAEKLVETLWDMGYAFDTVVEGAGFFADEMERAGKAIDKVTKLSPAAGLAGGEGGAVADFFEVGGSIPITPDIKFVNKAFPWLADPEYLKSVAAGQKAYEREFDRRNQAREAMWQRGERERQALVQRGIREREQEEEKWFKENYKREEDRIKLWEKGEKERQRHAEARTKEVARAEADLIKMGLDQWTGYQKSMLSIEADIATAKQNWLESYYENDFKLMQLYTRQKMALEKQYQMAKMALHLEGASVVSGTMAETFRIMSEWNKKYFKWYQAFATGEILVNLAIAVMRAYAELGPIWGSAAAVALGTLAGAQIAAVWKQEPPGELAEGGVSPTGFSALAGVYGQPTYVMAERQGKPEAVVPLDKYVVSARGEGGGEGVVNNFIIMAQDARTFVEFARRNKKVFRDMFTEAVKDNDPAVRSAVKAAVR